MIKRFLQNLFAQFLGDPIIPNGKSCGYSLVKSEFANSRRGLSVRVIPPYFIHGVHIGNYSYIARNSSISNCTIGKFCSIGPNFCCGLGIHPTNGISTSPMFYSTANQNGRTLCKINKIAETKPIEIGNDVFIGANVTVLDGVSIGNGAVIGAGAVVVDEIPPYAVAVGVPAKVVKYRFDVDVVDRLQEIKWWDWPEDELHKVESLFFDVNKFVK